MRRINKAYWEVGMCVGETLHQPAEVLKSRNWLVLMWLCLLKGIFSGLCPLPKEKLLHMGEKGVKMVRTNPQRDPIDFN